ncbi:tyramine beta-hydroxylase-like [Haliotis rubra]|uniref:tyramine beta-hydroxylase-like n=1 Tax=Haliotis rubra TaxID=36100 RepID=UPI001EE61E7F|nr:tyramine beta-hydroxylase-like [Haliotis rubra]
MWAVRLPAFLTCIGVIYGYGGYRDRIPNGHNLTHPCVTGEMWQGVGHVKPAGGGDRNQFGIDFANQGRKWANVCEMDSDGDGMTNGQELGDPQCIWTPGATPTRTAGLTHPGYCDTSSSQTCDGLATAPCQSSKFNCPAATEEGVKKRVLRIPRTAVPAKETTYICMTFDLDDSQDYHMIATEPEIDNVDIMHHIILYGCTDDAPAIESPRECDMSTPSCEEVTGSWAIGVPGECFYREAGFRIGKTGYKRVLLEFHWNNPQKISGQMDGSGFSIYYTPNLRPYDAGVFWTGETHIVIPPGRSRTVVESMCPSRCTKKILKDTIYLITGFNHMHYKGIAQTVELFSGDTRKYLTNDQSYSYDNPSDVLYDPPVAVHPGDSLKTTCVFRSVSSKTTTFYGDATSDEMCYGIFTYYPKNASRNNVCVTWKTLNHCDMDSGVLMGCSIADFFNNSHPNTKMVMDKVLDNCSPYGGCREECPAAIAEVEKHPCLAKGVTQDYMLTLRSRNYPDLKTTRFVAALGSCSCRKDDNNGDFPPHTGGATSHDVLASSVVLAFSAVLLF